MPLEENIEEIIKEETPQSVAVNSLIKVKDREIGKLGSDVELKTDLTEEGTCVHTQADMLTQVLEIKPNNFKKIPVFSILTQLKERKLLSLDRKSRSEIVAVARQPDINQQVSSIDGGFMRNFMLGKQQNKIR